MTEDEYQYVSSTLADSGFKIERIDETPQKSACVSVSQMSLKSSGQSISRKRSLANSNRVSASIVNNPQQSGGRISLAESERNEYRRLVQHMIRTHKMACQPFLFPVPDSVIGYYDIIKKPSDLTTIRQRLDSHSYANRGEFEADFLQMIWNAYIFNPPISDVFRAAMELHAAFVSGLQKSVIALNNLKRTMILEDIEKKKAAATTKTVNRPRPSASSSSAAKPTTEDELRKKLEFLQKVVARQSSSSKTQPPAIVPLNDRQLDQLASDLEQLDPKYVPQVAAILRGEPTARVADGQLDLSIHELPPIKQRELQRLLEKIKAQDALRDRLSQRVQDHSDDDSYL